MHHLSFPCKGPSSSSSSSSFSFLLTTFLLIITTPPHLPMEERVPSSTDIQTIPDPQKLQDPIHVIGSGTYIVQVPKDQVYRVPPPENALIVEQHRSNPARQSNPCLSLLFWIFISIFTVILILVLIALIIYLVVNPTNPTFFIKNFTVKNNTHSHNNHHQQHQQPSHLYSINLKSQNPNDGMGVFYQDGGVAKLSFKQKEIATGKLPPLYQGYKDLKTFRLDLAGANNIALPHEIQNSMKGNKSKVSVSFLLSVNVPVKMRIGLIKTWSMNMDIACSFKVNTLSKDIHVLSQKCDTAVHI